MHHHNIHRSNHSAPALKWDADLESSARQLAESCNYGHNTEIGGGGYGQNIGFQSGYDDVAALITNNMYNGEFGYFEGNFGLDNPTNFHEWGHLTQIVWKGTSKIGCVTADCPSLGGQASASNAKYTVCNYSPAGNVVGRYAENVGDPLGQAIVFA
ncbi:hypothetical protein FQN49_002572 [Arthroderma sp. PD_2]|nr:hypothetical protein FQN49_002572 [Arthroderma sp. PD_2]